MAVSDLRVNCIAEEAFYFSPCAKLVCFWFISSFYVAVGVCVCVFFCGCAMRRCVARASKDCDVFIRFIRRSAEKCVSGVDGRPFENAFVAVRVCFWFVCRFRAAVRVGECVFFVGVPCGMMSTMHDGLCHYCEFYRAIRNSTR